MTFNPSLVTNFFSCYNIKEHLVSGRLEGVHKKKNPKYMLSVYSHPFSKMLLYMS
jgi:hypothetical protein